MYRAPEPTQEQILNGLDRGYDPYDLVGIGPFWEMAPDHPLSAAAVIHDEMYLCKLSALQRSEVDRNFYRDCRILAQAAGDCISRLEAEIFPAIVLAASPFIDTSEDRNNATTREQGRLIMDQAKAWINLQALKIGEQQPYPGIT